MVRKNVIKNPNDFCGIKNMEVFSMNEKEAKWLLIDSSDNRMEDFKEK